MEVVTAVDGRVTNRGVARYQALEGRHLEPVSPRPSGPEVIALQVRTRQSNLYVAEAARTRVFREDELVPVERSLFQVQDYVQQVLAFDVHEGESVRLEKLVAFYTSRDRAIMAAGVPLPEVAAYSGHSVGELAAVAAGDGRLRSQTTLAVYTHATGQARERALEAVGAYLEELLAAAPLLRAALAS